MNKEKTKNHFEKIFGGILVGHMAGIPVFIGWVLWMYSDLAFANEWIKSETNLIIFYGSTWGVMVIGIIVTTILIYKNKIFSDNNGYNKI